MWRWASASRGAMSNSHDNHPTGVAWGPESETCGGCFWSTLRGPGPKVLRCLASGLNLRVAADQRACLHWEEEPECLDCAACCGPAFDAVEVGRRDPFRRLQPQLCTVRDGHLQVARTAENFCVCLQADNRCEAYADRPRTCRDFEKGGANCLFARRRVDLSPPWSTQS